MHLFLVSSVVLGLEVGDLLRLFAGLLDLLEGPYFFLLQHPDSVSELLNVLLDAQSNGPGLIVGQVFAFDVDHDVFVVVCGDFISARLC